MRTGTIVNALTHVLLYYVVTASRKPFQNIRSVKCRRDSSCEVVAELQRSLNRNSTSRTRVPFSTMVNFAITSSCPNALGDMRKRICLHNSKDLSYAFRILGMSRNLDNGIVKRPLKVEI